MHNTRYAFAVDWRSPYVHPYLISYSTLSPWILHNNTDAGDNVFNNGHYVNVGFTIHAHSHYKLDLSTNISLESHERMYLRTMCSFLWAREMCELSAHRIFHINYLHCPTYDVRKTKDAHFNFSCCCCNGKNNNNKINADNYNKICDNSVYIAYARIVHLILQHRSTRMG